MPLRIDITDGLTSGRETWPLKSPIEMALVTQIDNPTILILEEKQMKIEIKYSTSEGPHVYFIHLISRGQRHADAIVNHGVGQCQ